MAAKSQQPGLPRVLVTPRSLTKDPEQVTRLLAARGLQPVFGPAGELPSPDQLLDLVSGCVGWIAGVEQIGEAVLSAAHELRVVSRFGVGTSNVHCEAARRLGIDVRVATGANSQSVAELALGLTLDAIRGITRSSIVLKEGGWERVSGKELQGLVVAVAGYGSIGRIYAGLMARLGARPIVFDPMLAPGEKLPEGITRSDSLARAVSQADVLSFHCPPAKRPLFDRELIQAVQAGLVVINTARSELVDDQVMHDALEAGLVSSYAVDAFDREPPQLTELLTHPRVIATPHVGAYTEQAVQRTLESAVENLVTGLRAPGGLRAIPYKDRLEQELGHSQMNASLQIHWLGQAGFVVKTASGLVILIDPYLSDSLAEKYEGNLFPHVRMMEPPIAATSFPRVDVVLVTHAHSDHLDPGTIPALALSHPHALFVCPARVRDIAFERGIPPERFVGARGGEALDVLDGLRVHPIASAHESLDVTEEGSAFLGYLIEVEGEKIYHSGDCAPYPELAAILAGHSPSLALLPVNGRDEYRLNNGVPGNFWLEESLELCATSGIPMMVAHHWGMFEFNTLDEELLREAWLGYSGPVTWYIPSALSYLQWRPTRLRLNTEEA